MNPISSDSSSGSRLTSVDDNEVISDSSINSAHITPIHKIGDQNTEQDAQLQSTTSQQPASTDTAPASTELNRGKVADATEKRSNETLADILREKNMIYSDDVFDTDDKATWAIKIAKAMQWLLSEATYQPVPESVVEEVQDKEIRMVATPDLKRVNWKEWLDSKGPVTQPHWAIYLLSEDPPPVPVGSRNLSTQTNPRPMSQIFEQEIEYLGGSTLPPRIRIRSLPLMRILSGLCDDKLNYDRDEGLIIFRPFKIFEHLEPNIRNKLYELEIGRNAYGPRLPNPELDQAAKGNSQATGSQFNLDTIFRSDTDWLSLTTDEKKEAIRDLRCLVSFIDQYLVPFRKTLRTSSEVYFTQLWHLFMPGSLIYVKDKAIPQKVWRVIQGTGGRRNMLERSFSSSNQQLKLGSSFQKKCNPFVLDCYYIDWNGNRYIRIHKQFAIEEFSDLQAIASLPILPFRTAAQQGLINRNELLGRADQFIECIKPTYCYYSGRSMSLAPDGHRLRQPDPYSSDMGTVMTLSEYVESPVMVDFERGLQSIPDWAPDVQESSMSTTPGEELSGDANHQFVEDDRVWDVRIAEGVLGLKDHSSGWDKQSPHLSEEDKLLLPARVIAFVFRTRRWVCLELGRDPKNPKEQRLKSVKPKSDAWEELEISENHRNVIESLMASHFRKSKSERRQFDFVKDKGKGIIILLHGVPGVGKTSTAETVAEYYNKPLLPITCGDLGVTPRDVERNLESCFQMAQAWECVLLLDEADIFLAARNIQNENRNALVSVFLRVLEYYEGVLFLTTNQVGSFDEAFKSRISMALYYPPLTIEQTLHIWASQMKRLSKNFPEVHFNDMELQVYARELYVLQSNNEHYKPVWNGRQIRNAFQTAVSMAEFETKDKQPIHLTCTHFKRVAEVSNQFNEYLWRVKGSRTDEYRMRLQGLRDDSFTYNTAPTARVPSPVPPYQMQSPSYLTPQPSAVLQMAPLNMGNPTYPQPGLGPVMNPGQYIPPAPYNSQLQGYPGGQNPQYSVVQAQLAYTANQQQPRYISSSGYPSQSQGMQTPVQGQGQQQMAPPSNQNPQIQSSAQYGVTV